MSGVVTAFGKYNEQEKAAEMKKVWGTHYFFLLTRLKTMS
jgi:hypothetical protein